MVYCCRYCHKTNFETETHLNCHIERAARCREANDRELVNPTLEPHIFHKAPEVQLDDDGNTVMADSSPCPVAEDVPFQAAAPPRRFPCPTVEDVEDLGEDELARGVRFTQPYEGDAARILEESVTDFERLQAEQTESGQAPKSPFQSEAEWGLAKWMMKNLGHGQMDDLLSLDWV